MGWSFYSYSQWIIYGIFDRYVDLCVEYILFSSCCAAKSNRKLTFLYLANDVIQNSKKKGPEFAKDFESVLVDACSHVAR